MARGLPFTYGPSRTAPKSSTARAMGVIKAWNVSMSKPYTKLVVTDSRLMALDI